MLRQPMASSTVYQRAAQQADMHAIGTIGANSSNEEVAPAECSKAIRQAKARAKATTKTNKAGGSNLAHGLEPESARRKSR